mgnify:CR=1 FL=1
MKLIHIGLGKTGTTFLQKHVFNIISKDFIGLVIFVSPKPNEMDFFPRVLKLFSALFPETGK